ncbi:hypothetical protein Asppvi_005916 [Aspergillus pseudoviridinutans]|uniref:Uncharacterized protein n=1 Tax=Aspergillus pseudoviridinutans TaxID=1517512 RepID=A0A9P3B951_9EURO|nr:uncharacterized protein Asppvi_005916 [Aspergillus pseudoviridinutans]GIJ87016.1 hypothetical protein Asppvi_005916 [Aspergillus pseudoviridinutans]
MLESFAPTVLEDQPRFDNASASVIWEHFQKWVSTAPQEEQGIPSEEAVFKSSGRYKFCLMVNEEALQSVLNAPPPEDINDSGYVILVNGQWEPEVLTEDELAAYDSPPDEDFYDPIEGSTLRDVGWMKMFYDQAVINSFVNMGDRFDWDREYRRPPIIGFKF